MVVVQYSKKKSKPNYSRRQTKIEQLEERLSYIELLLGVKRLTLPELAIRLRTPLKRLIIRVALRDFEDYTKTLDPQNISWIYHEPSRSCIAVGVQEEDFAKRLFEGCYSHTETETRSIR